jgi:putative hemolysin
MPACPTRDTTLRAGRCDSMTGAMPLDRLRDLLGTEARFPDEEAGYRTLAGLVLHQLGRVPTESGRFEWNG